jgi:hypothetical protein
VEFRFKTPENEKGPAPRSCTAQEQFYIDKTMMASGMNNYASGSMNEYAGGGMHGASIVRPGPSRSGSRFAAAVRNPEHAEPWDQISDEHRSEINDCVSCCPIGERVAVRGQEDNAQIGKERN